MPIAQALEQHLTTRQIPYEVVTHSPTATSARTAQVAHVSGDKIAKAVLLKDDVGYLLAVLPATHHIRFDTLSKMLGRNLNMASEAEAGALFVDCELGAIPPDGFAYGLDMVVDDALEGQAELFLGAGDHTLLLRLEGEDFEKLMRTAFHGSFSTHD